MPRTLSRLAAALICVLPLCLSATAFAGWTSGAEGSGASRTAAVPAPGAPTATPISRGADVAWPAVTVGGTPVMGYEVFRRHQGTGTTVPATGACADVVTTTSCRDAAVETGTWTFTVRAVLTTWTGPVSVASNAVDVDSDIEASLDVTPRSAAPGDTITVTGFGWDADEVVRLEVGGVEMCTVTAGAGGAFDDECELPGRPAGDHAVRGVGDVTVAAAGNLTATPVLRAVSSVVTAGAQLSVRPRGFAAAAQLEVRLDDQLLGTVTTSAAGETPVSQFAVPATTPEGTYELEVTDAQGNRATASVEVATASLQVTPAAAAPGQEVAVTGAGWPDSATKVQLHVDSTFMCEIAPDEDGAISATCSVPDVQGGARELRAGNGVAVAQQAFEVQSSVRPETTSTSAGSTLRLTARGLTGAGQPVAVTIDDQPVTPSTPATVSGNGRAVVDIVVPDLPGGEHTVRVTDATGRSATTSVTVVVPEVTLSRWSGAPGDQIEFGGRNWPADATVTLHLGPVNLCSTTAGPDGNLDPTTCALPNLPGGPVTIRATGGGANAVAPIPFEVTARLTLDPTRAAAGQTASARAVGLAADSDVVLSVDGTQVATARTTSNGLLNATSYTVPDLPAGSHTVRVTDAAGGTATAELTVFAPTVELSKWSAAPEETFQFSGQNWPANTRVVIDFGPVNLCSAETGSDGTINPTTCAVPYLPGGPVTIRLTGGGATVVAPTPFEVRARLTLDPTRAAAGQTARARAVGLAADSDVVLSIDGTQVATARTTGNGILNATSYTVPDLPAGPNTVRVTDAAGGTATAELTVFAPTLTMSRWSGAPDEAFTFSGQNWPADTSVLLNFGPVNLCSASTGPDGTINPTTCRIPYLPRGPVTIRGTGGGVIATASTPFEVTPLVILDPPRAAAGQAASARAVGLAVDSDVVLSVDGTQVATARTTGNGVLNPVSYTVPDLPAGTHTVRVTDATGGTATAELTVFAPTVELSKWSGAPGEAFQFSGQNWPADTRVVINFGPNNLCSGLTGSDGSLAPTKCTVPTLPAGPVAVRLTGGGVTVVASTPFVITAQPVGSQKQGDSEGKRGTAAAGQS